MKIRRYILTVAIEDGKADHYTLGEMESLIIDGFGSGEGISASIGLALADERTVTYPDPKGSADPNGDDAAYEAWQNRAEEEVYK